MTHVMRIAKNSLLLGLIGLMFGCVVAPPHEGYYDGEHHRYYHENAWHDCGDHDPYCR
jgi:hypothetical protein